MGNRLLKQTEIKCGDPRKWTQRNHSKRIHLTTEVETRIRETREIQEIHLARDQSDNPSPRSTSQ
jgi:hypothetical protein